MEHLAGNAREVAEAYRGWILGSFVPDTNSLLYSELVEVKWGQHAAGEARSEWAAGTAATSISILIHGDFIITFAEREYRLQREGDFCIWGPGVAHTWRAVADSLVLTVRWPSLPASA